MKYKYDLYSYDKSGNGCTGALGATNLTLARRNHRSFVEHHPYNMHLLIRRPDNKLMNFYHPFKNIDGVNE